MAYQWLDAVSLKGEGKARRHIGVTAQAVRDAFLAEGCDPEEWGLFCADPRMQPAASIPIGQGSELPSAHSRLDEDGQPMMRLGLRPDQLLLLAAWALSR